MPRAHSIALSDFTTFGDFLKYLRRRAQMTQGELATACGYSTPHISHLESNQRLTDQATLLALFVPALGLQDEPELVERLLALAAQARMNDVSNKSNSDSDGAPSPRNNLPQPSTPFVGRSEELTHITTLLNDSSCRLLTLIGPGGIGKTRLAIQAAAENLSEFANGAFFVSLVGISSPEFIVSAIAEALGFTFQGTSGFGKTGSTQEDIKTQLSAYLREKSMLLLLDDFDHLLDGGGLLVDILNTASAVKILVTSRVPLSLQEEWTFPVGGLEVPRLEGEKPLEEYSAIQLFVQRARHIQFGFSLSEHNISVVRVCRLLEGMPLGIELAAGLLRMVPVADMVAHIEQNIDVLATSLRNVPERHRSLRAVFEQSWIMLSKQEQDALMKLAVFRGGFPNEAALYVTEVPFRVLLALVEKSLVRLNHTGRYDMHELLRQFAGEQLNHVDGAGDSANDRHCAYYSRFLFDQRELLEYHADKTAIEEVRAEIENVRASWNWAVTQGKKTEISQSLQAFHVFLSIQGWFGEGLETFRNAAKVLGAEVGGTNSLLYGQLLVRQAFYETELHASTWQNITSLLKPSLTIFEALDEHWESALANKELGVCELRQTQYGNARQYLAKSIELFRRVDSMPDVADCLFLLGTVAWQEGSFEEADRAWRESQVIAEASNSKALLAATYSMQAEIAEKLGTYEVAWSYSQRSLVLDRQTGNRRGVANSLITMSVLSSRMGNHSEARSLGEEGLAIYSEIGFKPGVANALRNLASVEAELGNLALALQYSRQSADMYKVLNRQAELGIVLSNLSSTYWKHGDYVMANQVAQESVEILRKIGRRNHLAAATNNLGHALLSLGQYDGALQSFQESLAICLTMRLYGQALLSVLGMAQLRTIEGRADRALELLGLVLNHPACDSETLALIKPLLTNLEAELPPEVVAVGLEHGKSLDLEAVVAELLKGQAAEE